MANKALFRSGTRGQQAPAADTKNAAGGLAYSFTPEHQLAQLASTGTFNDTFYEKASDQLDALRQAADKCSPEFIARCAVYARQKAFMKDMPAALAVILSKADPALLDKVFDRVIDNGKQVRNFVQFVRSGAFGRKSMGSGPKRLVKRWFANRSDYAVFRASVGNAPSLADVIKLVRPKPSSVMGMLRDKGVSTGDIKIGVEARGALYAYLIGKPHEFEALPGIVQQYERFKQGDRANGVPNVDFRMLTSLPLTKEDWAEIARNGKWHQTRMNLNTYARHGVLEDEALVRILADRLRDPEEIKKARSFPYQLLAAYLNTGPDQTHSFGYYGRAAMGGQKPKEQGEVPQPLRLALQDAMEAATENVPTFEGRVAVIVDTSGSMGQAVTGYRSGATSKVRCVDVAALVAATVARKNPLTVLIPVDTQVHDARGINPRDSIVTNAEKLARFGGGGTDLGAAMRFIETAKAAPDLIIMVSDNESWVGDASRSSYYGTQTMECFNRMHARNPGLKMVNIDIVASTTSQTPCKGQPAILNCGGFSDAIWDTIARFVSDAGPEQWVKEINEIPLDTPTA